LKLSKTLNDYRLLYRPQLVADGNMKLVHLKMQRPEEDISLFDGEQNMVKCAHYVEHLVHTPQRQPVRFWMSIINLCVDLSEEIKM
jgi:hypothetical protein